MSDKVKQQAEEAAKPTNILERILILIRTRKWDTLIFITMLALIGVLSPLAIGEMVSNSIADALEPLSTAIEDTRESLQSLEEFNVISVQNSAIVAYNKIKTVEDLEPLTQNGLAIREGLRNQRIREVLASIDLERTRLFEQYFFGE